MNTAITTIAALPNAYQLLVGIKTSTSLAERFAEKSRESEGEDRVTDVRLQRNYEGQADGMLRAALIVAGVTEAPASLLSETFDLIADLTHAEIQNLVEEAANA